MSQSPQPPVVSPTTVKDEAEAANRGFLDRQSRTIGTYGLETVLKLQSVRVLIAGCRGIGAETAKNLALAGVHTISLYDPHHPTERDLGTNFAITSQSLHSGDSRAKITAVLMSELNPNTRVKVVEEGNLEDAILAHDVFIVTSAAPSISLFDLVRWNKMCHTHQPTPIAFLFCYQGGAIGSVFVDFGDQFVVTDPDGRSPLQKAISEVVEKTDKHGRHYTRIRFFTPEGMMAGALRDHTELLVSDVKGLTKADGTSLNGKVLHVWIGKNDPPSTVRVYPSLREQGYSPYIAGGFLTEQKEKKELVFRTLDEALASPPPTIITNSMMDGSNEANVHLAVYSMLRYAEHHHGTTPKLRDAEAASEVIAIAKAIQSDGEARLKQLAPEPDATPPKEDSEIVIDDGEAPSKLPPPPPPQPFTVPYFDEDFIRNAALTAGAQLQPFCAVIGAIAAQEVVKLSGKYTPIHQFLHFHCHELLRAHPAEETALHGSRYDDLIAIFGKSWVENLRNSRVFLVGCGALGCEDLKNFALCGIGTGPQGHITVTDNDRIELSNLSRQFLFREANVSQPKAVAAKERVLAMNPDIKIDARQDFVGPSTENIFDDKFWQSLSFVVNALDNIPARLFVDGQCVFHEKILVEAGTMGTAGNVDIIVPHKTTSYADGGAADESGGIPMCTLRNFPYIYDHCIEWARAQFDDLFVAPLMLTQQLREDPAAFCDRLRKEVDSQSSQGAKRSVLSKNIANLTAVLKTVKVLSSKPTMEDCVRMAFEAFHAQFRDRIVNLITSFPKDAKKSNGEPFWGQHRRFPHPVEVEERHKIPDVYNFLISAANLFAAMFGLHGAKHHPKFNDPKHRWKAEYRSHRWLDGVLAKLPVPPIVKAAVDDLDEEATKDLNKGNAALDDDANEREFVELLKEAMNAAGNIAPTAAPLDFEKDDDDNFHIDFVAAAANLRALNYDIGPQDALHVKLVAGKIIPAIATTTAAVTGFSLVELFKVLAGCEVHQLRNGMIDLGVNNYVMFDRDPPVRVKTRVEKTYYPESDYTEERKIVAFPEGFTKYDKIFIDVTPSTRVADFVRALEERTRSEQNPEGYSVSALGLGTAMVWNGMPSHPNTTKPILDVIAKSLAPNTEPAAFWGHKSYFSKLVVNLETPEGDEVIPAPVVLRLMAQ